MTSPSAVELLTVQLRRAWLDARRVLDGLTRDEYLWEPTSPCWSVRLRGPDVRGWGAGEYVCEDAWPPPDPLPSTTIAWRVVHLAAWTDIYRAFAFDGTQPDLNDAHVPGDHDAAIAWLVRSQDAFIAAVEALDDDEVFTPRPAHWGDAVPVVQLVTTMLTEHVHHLAEVGVLRDLHRGHAVAQPSRQVSLPEWWTGRTGGTGEADVPSSDLGAGEATAHPDPVDLAVDDLVARLGLDDRETVIVVGVEEVTWRDRSLGCPLPGMQYLQVLTPGVRIVLRVGSSEYHYHGGAGRDPFYCATPQSPAPS